MTINALWELVKDELIIDKSEFIANLEGWEIEQFPRFIRINRGAEFHFIPTGNGNGTRQDIRDCVQPIIDRNGFAATHTPIEDTRQHRFNKLVGFIETGRDARYVYFRIEELRHV